jgi:hypothetical protein
MIQQSGSCDIVINLTGVYVKTERCEYGPYGSRRAAEFRALDLGFTSWAVWEYEHHIADVVIDKQTLAKAAYV